MKKNQKLANPTELFCNKENCLGFAISTDFGSFVSLFFCCVCVCVCVCVCACLYVCVRACVCGGGSVHAHMCLSDGSKHHLVTQTIRITSKYKIVYYCPVLSYSMA